MFKLKGKSLHRFYKKVLSVILSLSIVAMTLLTGLTANAAVVNGTDNPAFSVTAYDTSARIEIPAVENATCYRVYLSQTKDTDLVSLTADTSARCVFSSTYKSYDYVLNGDTDELNSANTVSISQNMIYYFYLVTNDGSADALQATVKASTKATADCYWTSGGNYDISWYTTNTNLDAYTISTEAQLAGLAVLNNGLKGVSSVNFSGKTITISESLDLSAWLWTPIGTQFIPFRGNVSGTILNSVSGEIESCTHTIKGLHTNTVCNYQGLFGSVDGTSTISNIGIVDGYVEGNMDTAGIVGCFKGTAIQNSYNTCSVSGKDGTAGGIAGCTLGNINSCYNTGNISGTYDTGGIAGYSEGAMLNCYNTGVVDGYEYVGGVVGCIRFSKSRLYACHNTGTVTASYMEVGGIAGCSELCPIDNCYNSGSVYSESYAAGIVGAFDYTGYSLSNSYNNGSINGNYRVGGICGKFGGDSIDNCYNAGNVSHIYYGGEITAVIEGGTVNNCYYNSDTAYFTAVGNIYGIGKTPPELKALAGALGTAFVTAPSSYADGGVFSSSNPVNGGYPVLTAFGYSGGSDVDSQFEKESGSGFYLLKNAYQLDLVRNYCGSGNSGIVFKLAGNMDLSNAAYNDFNLCWQPIGSNSNPFCDTFKGSGYSVSGITITGLNSYRGLFGYNSGTIENLGVTGVDITSWQNAGGIVGYNTGIVSNCSSTGILRGIQLGDNIGGIVGDTEGGSAKVSGCSNACAVSGGGWIGGVVGYSDSAILNCSNTGFIIGIKFSCSPGEAGEIGGIVGVSAEYSLMGCYNKGTVCGNKNVGGIAGYLTNIDGEVSGCGNTGRIFGKSQTGGIVGYIRISDILKKCHNEGTVTGYTSDSTSIGGIAGKSDLTIQSCCNTGTITGGGAVGGISGSTEYGTLTYCYNTGLITGSNSSGGIVGDSKYAFSYYCYNIGVVASSEYAGGISGTNTGWVEIKYCYSTGLIQGSTSGGICGSVSSSTGIAYNSYLGCCRSIGGVDNKNQGGKPFTALVSDSIKAAGTTSITQQNCVLENNTFLNQMGADFAVTYSRYQSDNTDVASVSGLTVTGGKVGAAAITGTITITQDELNMQDDSGFTGTVKTVTVPVSFPLTVTKATPAAAVSVSSNSVTVGNTLTLTTAISNAYAPTGTVTFYNNGTSVGSTDTISSDAASVSYTPTATGSLSITAKYSGDTNNTAAVSGNTQNVTLEKRSPVLTTVTANPSSPKAYPVTSVSLSTALSNYYGPLNGQTILFYDGNNYLGTALTGGDGKAVYTLTNPGADTYQFTARFGGDINNNTAKTNISTAYTVNKGTQANLVIDGVSSSVTYGDANFTLSSSGGSGTNNTYTYFSNNTDILSVDSNGRVGINGAGNAVITVTKAGDENYNPISKDILITVTQKTLDAVITPNNKQYDASADATVKTIDYTGIVGSDDVNISGGTLLFLDKTAASSKQIFASNYVLGGTKAANYSLGVIYVNSADITKKELTVSVKSVIIDCGQSISNLSVEIAGFVPGENEENVAGFAKPTVSAHYNSLTTALVNGVPLPVIYSGGNAADNYEFSYSYITSLTIRAVAVTDGDYQVSGKYAVSENPTDWNTENFTITPSNGYDLISTDGTKWVSNLAISSEGQNRSVAFKLKKTTDGAQTESYTIYYNMDKTVPTIHVTGNPVDLVKSAKLTIHVMAGASGIKSVKANGNDITDSYKNGYTVTQNGDYKFTVTNGAGVTEEQTVKVSEIQSVVITNEKIDSYKNGYTVTQNGDYKFTVTNGAGVTEKQTVKTSEIKPVVITNEKTGLTFDLSNVNLPSGMTSVSVSSAILPKSGADSGVYATVSELIGSSNLESLSGLTVYDLKLLDQNGNPITNLTGKIKVKIPIPEGMSGTPHIFWYNATNGTLTDMNAIEGNGYLTFETTHFGCYAIAELKTASTSVPNPPTGSGKALLFLLVLLGVGLVGFIVVRKRMKYRVKK